MKLKLSKAWYEYIGIVIAISSILLLIISIIYDNWLIKPVQFLNNLFGITMDSKEVYWNYLEVFLLYGFFKFTSFSSTAIMKGLVKEMEAKKANKISVTIQFLIMQFIFPAMYLLPGGETMQDWFIPIFLFITIYSIGKLMIEKPFNE